MKRAMSVVILIAMVALLVGCSAHIHTVGKGPQKGEFTQERQWYALWGLVPINTVNSNAMAGGSSDYEIKTEASALDIIINIFTTYVSVTSRTVTVTR